MDDSVLVEIQAGKQGSPSQQPPFWLLHPVGGHVMFAHRFARLLPAAQPLLGLQSVGLDGRREPLRSISEMASYYLSLIRARQPQGPYYLGGPSFGGYIAYELGQRLWRRGERVGMLCLFDVYGPNYPRRLSQPAHLRDWWRYLSEMSGRERFLRLRQELARRGRLRRQPAGVSEGLLAPIARVMEANEQAARAYRPAPYPGRLHLFRATQTPRDWPGRSFEDRENGWGALAKQGVEVIPVQGSHSFLFDEPAVRDLARSFAFHLAELQQRHV